MATSSLALGRTGTYLTKTLFQKAWKCPRKLAYALNPQLYPPKKVTSFFKNLANDGKKIGIYSRLLYPEGITVTNLDVDEAVEKTTELLASNETITIFEGAIRSGSCLVRADILQKMPDGVLRLLEVKAKSWDAHKGRQQLVGKRGGIKADFLPYIRDVAFQKHVISQAFPGTIVQAWLVLPDKSQVNTKIGNLNKLIPVDDRDLDSAARDLILRADQMLVTEVDVDELADMVISGPLKFPGSSGKVAFEEAVDEWVKVVEETSKQSLPFYPSPPPIGNHCKDCEFRLSDETHSGFRQCWKEATQLTSDDNLVIDIYSGGASSEALIQRGRYQMADVRPEDLKLGNDGADLKPAGSGISRSKRQWLQVSETESLFLDELYLRDAMGSWEYPFHFIDFESIAPVLPFTVNKGPFDVLAFQFSHHKLNADGTLVHASEFLHAEPMECPNRPFLDALAESLRDERGTVFRWGSHENTVLATLLRSENYHGPNLDLIEALLRDGEKSMVDLMAVVAKGLYVKGTEGSSSLKKLLLPTLRECSNLKYLYGQPTYVGKNFENFQWWQESVEGEGPIDPYTLVGMHNSSGVEDPYHVTDGGDAIIAYQLLQDRRLEPSARDAIKRSLLQYCELDTLAMAMVLQGMRGALDSST